MPQKGLSFVNNCFNFEIIITPLSPNPSLSCLQVCTSTCVSFKLVTFFVKCGVCVCLFVYLFLDTTCFVCIMLLTCMFSGLTTWYPSPASTFHWRSLSLPVSICSSLLSLVCSSCPHQTCLLLSLLS